MSLMSAVIEVVGGMTDCFCDGTEDRIVPYVVSPIVPSHTAVVENMQ